MISRSATAALTRKHPASVTQLLPVCYLPFTRQPRACFIVALSRIARSNGAGETERRARTDNGKAIEWFIGMY